MKPITNKHPCRNHVLAFEIFSSFKKSSSQSVCLRFTCPKCSVTLATFLEKNTLKHKYRKFCTLWPNMNKWRMYFFSEESFCLCSWFQLFITFRYLSNIQKINQRINIRLKDGFYQWYLKIIILFQTLLSWQPSKTYCLNYISQAIHIIRFLKKRCLRVWKTRAEGRTFGSNSYLSNFCRVY